MVDSTLVFSAVRTPLDRLFSKRRIHQWLYQGHAQPAGPHAGPTHTAAWWKVMCLTGVDYFSTLAYVLKVLAFGEGDTAPVAREVLRKSEPNPLRRPRVHVG